MKRVCINLDRREDRWNEFYLECPFEVERFAAIDGHLCPQPGWWSAGSGAWGCYRSHLRIIEDALNANVNELMILEDDARFVENFDKKFERYLKALPDDWEWAYLGGQHLHTSKHPPERVNDHVLVPYNINRTHAYMVRGQSMLRALYKHLQRKLWKPAHHIDHHYGQLIQERKHGIYTPDKWLVLQAEGKSNISGREVPERSWQPNRILEHTQPMVAVVGPFRGGTSCVAGVLHKLGISMGHRFKPAAKANPTGFFEAQWLAQICRRCYKEPRMEAQGDFHWRARMLGKWAYERKLKQSKLHGGKHPSFCMLVPELVSGWRNVKFIRVTRPIEESVASLKRLNWWPPGVADEVIPRMVAKRDEDLTDLDYHTVSYHSLMQEPEVEVRVLLKYLAVDSHPAQIEDAVSFVEKR